MNSRIVLALAVSAGMALLVTGVFYQIAMRGRTAEAADAGSVEVVVAVKDLEVGSIITAADLRVEEWPQNRVAPDVYTAIEEVVERAPVSRILADEPVLERRLAPKGAGYGLSTKVPEGMRAMSIRVDDVNGVAGFVLPEASVDVLVTGTPTDDSSAGQRTRTILSNVRVLSAGEHLTPDASGRPQRVPVVTLLLSPEQAEMVTLAQLRGKIQLVLRNAKDEQIAETRGVSESELYGSGPPRPVRPHPQAPVALAAPIPPPAPPEVEVQIIRGNKIEVQSFGDAEAYN